jgi:hypothetical protein
MLILAFVFGTALTAAPMVVHEWGTITTRHDSKGAPVGKLNRIRAAEVLPAFVHHYEPPQSSPNPLTKSAAAPGNPDVTMRLETPVIYFYPPSDWNKKFDVNVFFRGGVINEFFPNAVASQDIDFGHLQMKSAVGVKWDGRLNNVVRGKLEWKDVELAEKGSVPETNNPVWLAPRAVKSAFVKVGNETENYLFYRGVAHLDSLIRTEIGPDRKIKFYTFSAFPVLNKQESVIPKVWIANIISPQVLAFRELSHLRLTKDLGKIVSESTLNFQSKEFSERAHGNLKNSIRSALIQSGLFENEANAMIETWKEPYFSAPGTRIFYIVPREWIDYYLPLTFSVPTELKRVLVGRVDLE